jgi:hypothetical protein
MKHRLLALLALGAGLSILVWGCAVNFGEGGSASSSIDRHLEGTNRVTEIKVGPSP